MTDRRYSYSLTIEGRVFNISPIVDSSSLSVMSALCSTKKKSAKNNMSVSLKGGANPSFYTTFMQALLESQANNTINDCLFIVTDTTSNTVMFSGYLDSSEIEINSKHFPDSLELSAMDKTMLLDNKIRVNQHWENTSRNQIVKDLIDAMEEDTGKTISLLSTELSDTDKIGNYSVTEDMNKTYRDIIDLILFEAVGYVIVYDPQNDGYRIKRIPTTLDENTTYRQIKYMVGNGLKTKSVLYKNDGILLSYPTIVTRQNTNLYFENISLKTDDNGKLKGDTVYSGQYYPKDGDVKAIHQNYRIADRPYVSGESRLQNEDLKLLYAKDVKYDLASNPQLSLAPALPNIDWDGTPRFYPNKAWVLFRNDNSAIYIASEDASVDDSKTYYTKSGDVYTPIENPSSDANPKQNGWYEEQGSNVTTFSLTGTAIYVDYMNKLTVPNLCQNPEEYEVQTITDAQKAKDFAQWYYNSQRYGGTTSQWNEPEGYSTLGEIVYVVHKETGIQMPHVIVQMTDECAGGASGTIRMKKVVAISLYGWQEYTASTVTANRNGSNTSSEQTPSRWTNGTALWGESTARGWEGNVGDYYLNTENYNLYRCTTSGTSSTALWTYIGNIKGADADINANTYTIEYSLSTSPSEYTYPFETIGYTDDDDFGSIDNDPDSSTYGEETNYGLRDQVWTSSPSGWYKGLYVWQRLKTTDADGEVTYGEPTYAKSTTEALINGCILDIVVIDSDGDGDTHTWEKNLADSTTDVLLQFKLISRSYQSITAFKSALQSLSLSFCKASAVFSNVVLTNVTPSTENFDDANNLVTLTYSYTFKKNVNADSIVINALIEDGYLKEDGTTYSLETTATSTLNSVDVTEFDAFGGLFATDAIAEQYFKEQNGGLLDGYTYAVSNTNASDYLSLRTYVNNGWGYLSSSGFSEARISEICSKAQKAVLAKVEEGSVTATDYAYFNVLIANVITADFIGAKQIQMQDDGYIYGGSVTPSNPVGERVTGQGFIIDSQGVIETYQAILNQARVLGQMDFTDADILHPCFTTVPAVGVDKEVLTLPSPTHWFGGDCTLESLSANTMTSVSSSYYDSTMISRVCRCTNPSAAVIASGTSIGSGRVYGRTYSASVTIGENGRYRCTISFLTTFIGAVAGDGYAQINLNGSQVLRRTTLAAWNSAEWSSDLSKGDVLTFIIRTATGGDIDTDVIQYNVTATSVLLSSSGITSTGVWYSNSSNNWSKIPIDYIPSATRCVINEYFDSNDYIRYLTLGSVASNYMSDLNDGVVYSATGSVAWEGSTALTPTFMTKNGDVGTLICIDGNNVKHEISMSSSNYVYISGTVQILASKRGLKTMAMYPDENLEYDLGSDLLRYAKVFCQAVDESSQRALKTNIVPFEDNALDLLKSVDVVSFNFKSDMKLDESERTDYIGFIADDTDSRLSGKRHDKFISMSCIGVLIKAVQELSAELERLKEGK